MSDNNAAPDARLAEVLDQALSELRSGGRPVSDEGGVLNPSTPELASLLETMRALESAVRDCKAEESDAPSVAPANNLQAPTPADPGTASRPSSAGSHTRPQVSPPVSAAGAPPQMDRYQILERIGRGGMGTVYKARDAQLRRVIALKVPHFSGSAPDHSQAQQRFLREARSAAAVRHPHVCPIYDVGECHGVPYVVMAYVEGKSLAERLAAGVLYSCREAVTMARQVAEGLAAVHAAGVVHRDLKPANILIDADGQAVLADFGLARPKDDAEHLTAEGAVVGTPAYMAPEQASAEWGEIGPRTDLYSLGAVLYVLLAGRPPFQKRDAASVLLAVVSERPAPVGKINPTLPRPLADLVMRLLAKKSGDRPGTAREVAEALAALERDLCAEEEAAVKADARGPAKPLRKRALWAALASAAPRRRRVSALTACLTALFGLGLASVAAVIVVKVRAPDGKQTEVTAPAGSKVEVDPKGGVTVTLPGEAPAEPARAVAPFDAAKAIQFQQAWADYLGVPVVREADLGGGVKMELKLIPPGTFRMGSPEDENGRTADEGPQHPVEITRPFYLGTYPVTKGQFAAFVQAEQYETEPETDGQGGYGYNAATHRYKSGPKYSWKNTGWDQTDAYPVVNVTWHDAQRFCAWLSKKEGQTYALPTEAEWEYACRAGTTTRFWCGDADASLKGNENVPDASLKAILDPACYGPGLTFAPWDDGYPFTSPVGAFKANPWGLYDMLGNVRQWCASRFGRYKNGYVKDPAGDEGGDGFAMRGGSFYGGLRYCRSAFRNTNAPAERHNHVGFRVAWRPPVAPQAAQDDEPRRHFATLTAAQQIDAVAAELKARNPGFDGNVTPTIESGLVVGLQFNTYKVTDISPVRALPGLRGLDFASGPNGGWLADLSPLKGVKLTDLDLASTQVSDLSPLKDMKLRGLNLAHTHVTDLSPLSGMKLTYLCCYDTPVSDLTPLKDMKLNVLLADVTSVSDLTPLKGMKLTVLHFGTSAVSDLTPLKDMNLTELNCGSTAVCDLSPLKHMKITDLNFANTKVSDLTPLADMKLTHLDCSGAPVADLSPLNGMPLTDLNLDRTRVCDLSPLKDMKLKILNVAHTQVWNLTPLADMKLTYLNCWGTRVSDLSPVKNLKLTTLNCGVTSVSDLTPVKNMELTDLNCGTTAVFDLSPLRHMKLTDLNCSYTKVSDLTPLHGMPLTHLDCTGAPVSDLSPLKDIPLTRLDCENTRVSDLSPLKGMPLTELRCDFKAERDAAIVRSIKTLETINGKPAAEFWKDVDAKKQDKKP